MDQPPPVAGATQQSQKKPKGCFFWGITTLVIIVVCVGGCTAFLAYFVRSQVLRFTSTEQIAVKKYELKPGEYQALEKRFDEFSKAADKAEPARLEISEDDLNAFIAGNPDTKGASGKAHARIEGSEVLLDVSIPLDGIPTLGGRYFNGTLGVELGIVQGRLVVFPQTAIVNGEAVPEEVMQQFRKEDLFKNQRKSGPLAEFLEKAKTLEVRDGKIVLTR